MTEAPHTYDPKLDRINGFTSLPFILFHLSLGLVAFTGVSWELLLLALVSYYVRMFGVTAGFASRDIQTTGGVWRIDMTKCPYHDASVHYGCPELCHCFCDSDDITYDGLHPKLYWHRTKTLGRGGDCCDFCLKLRDK